ncbi:pre-mRNA-splicing factor CWC22 homolog [Mangifera indica]|uniref:pre-mRNA-splicing factor CWC22 homolog n=1 Tax=Mangifera indica TaxID=29780 RepID=UPI001CFA7647|nr:pre-mRNA-splicing factor CWC22 homolog [Mangifera indica]
MAGLKESRRNREREKRRLYESDDESDGESSRDRERKRRRPDEIGEERNGERKREKERERRRRDENGEESNGEPRRDRERERKRRDQSAEESDGERKGDKERERRRRDESREESDGELRRDRERERRRRKESGNVSDGERRRDREKERRRRDESGEESDGERRRDREKERRRKESGNVSDGERRRDREKRRSHPDESGEERKLLEYESRDRHRKRGRDDSGRDRDWDRDRRRRSERDEEDRNQRKKDEGRDDRYDRDKAKDRRLEGDQREEGELVEVSKKSNSAGENANVNVYGNAALSLGRSGGVYIPPFKLARMMKEVEDKSSVEYQRLTWDALRKSINGLVNKVNATNIKNIIPELFAENLIRGRGLFCRSCMKSQMASPGFTDVFAALAAVVNTKFPEVGLLLLRRIVLQFQRAYKRNDKPQLLAAVKFIAHLVNQQVAHEIIALELLMLLLTKPTDDSVEVAVGFVTECGSILQDLSPRGLHGIFERFRGILHEGEIDKRVQFLIEGLFAIRKAKFQGYPAVRPELDLVEQEDQFTHEISLDDKVEPEITLDIFKPDPQFLENEKRYEELKKTILGEESDDEEGSDAASGDEDDDDEEESEEDDEEQMQITDETETNLVNLRRTIYLTIMSSVDFEEAGHKLLKIKLEPGQEMELCIMLLECCSQERTYLRYYGLLGQRFCMINKVHQENFEKCFVQQYSMIHRLETNKLRNVAKFFAHLLGTDALPWHVLAYIRLTEEDTTSSSRIFIKILFQELSEHLGIRLLNERLTDPTMQDSYESIFPKDNPKNTRFSINFFTSIGLGGITENLREYLKNMPRLIMQQQKPASESESESGSGSEDGSDSEASNTDSESASSEDERDRKRRKQRRRH